MKASHRWFILKSMKEETLKLFVGQAADDRGHLGCQMAVFIAQTQPVIVGSEFGPS
jgi:hypothetical protein